MKCLSLTMLWTAALLALPAWASAQEQPEPPGEEGKAQLALVVARSSVRPGETIPVGIKFTMQPGWHIYWKNPGDSGQAPRFDWSLPGGGASRMMRGSEWTATEPQYPVPVKWEDAGGLVGYGYTQTVIFPAEIRVPPSATPGQVVEVGIVAKYLVCKEVCLSEWASAGVKLRVTAESADEESEQDAAAARELEQAQKRMPEPRPGMTALPAENGTMTVTVELPEGAKNVGFFPDSPAGLVVEDIQVRTEGNRATAAFRVRAMAGAKVDVREFAGVVGYDTNQGRRGVSITVPVPEDLGGQ